VHRLQDARRDPRTADRLILAGIGTHVGRFAPSPTGALHAGSLVAAVASQASIRSRAGRFTVRIDDLDVARVVPGADRAILQSLRAFGLLDERTPIVRQADRRSCYHEALRVLAQAGLLYRCGCSRRQLAGHAIYPGTCRGRTLSVSQLEERLAGHDRPAGSPAPDGTALRVHLQGTTTFDDAVQGERRVVLERDVGDVIVLRRDTVIAWPLATAVDDAGAASEVVRGADLFDPTPAQVALIERLGRTPPRYAHVPVLCDRAGRKLGKQTGAPALDPDRALALLQQVWSFLGQRPFHADSLDAFHALSPAHWSIERVPAERRRHDPRLAPPRPESS